MGSALVLISLITFCFIKRKPWFLKEKEMDKDLKRAKEAILKVPDMTCQHCVRSIEGVLKRLDGIKKVGIALKNKTVKVGFEDEIDLEGIVTAINSAGYEVKDIKESDGGKVQ